MKKVTCHAFLLAGLVFVFGAEACGGADSRGFVRAERATPEMIAAGRTPGLVDSRTGARVQLRGVNAGGWLVTENWMCPTGPASNKVGRCQYELADAFRAKFGAEKAEELWDLYRANWWREEDFANVRDLGLNCIRLPFGWRELMTPEGEPIEKGLKRIDWFVEGCRANDLYVILDLHGAPGGQNGRDHSGDVREHRLVSDPASQDLCTKLWTTLAARYRNDTTVAGYDFLNEPEGAPGGLTSTNGVMQIYDRLYKAVRAVDPDHLIFLGACWTPEQIDPPADHGWENVCYEYHFYEWGKKTAAEINAGTDDRVKWERAKGHHVPVFVGEFNLFDSIEAWEYGLKTFDELGWSWAIWTYKVTGPHMNWGLYQGLGRTAPFKATPDDDYETIKRKWSRLGTSESFTLRPFAHLLKSRVQHSRNFPTRRRERRCAGSSDAGTSDRNAADGRSPVRMGIGRRFRLC